MKRDFKTRIINTLFICLILQTFFNGSVLGQEGYKISQEEYQDKVQAIWSGQMIAALMGFKFEHYISSVKWVDTFSLEDGVIPVDDDWYYEMVALRAFEKYGIDMTVEDLGKQWLENTAGTWGSSNEALLLLRSGTSAYFTGHPRYNKLWFTIGPQFSSDIYGALNPGMPHYAAAMANRLARINGFGEALDGALFVSAMISLGFIEKDTREIVRQAASLIRSESPFRKSVEMVIENASQGKSFEEVVEAIEDKWHIEYPATNNAVANGGIVAAAVWFGEGDFLKTLNLAFSAADFTDADCNAANAASVIGAMKGLKGIPANLLKTLGDRIKGEKMGDTVLTPAVDESLKQLSFRTAKIGEKIITKNGATISNGNMYIPVLDLTPVYTELFSLSDLMKYWNPEWELARAGFGGGSGGLLGIRGNTHLKDSILVTYPRDEVRGLYLKKTIEGNKKRTLKVEVGVDQGNMWRFILFQDNQMIMRRNIFGEKEGVNWYKIKVDLPESKEKIQTIRIFQRVLFPNRRSGNAYWKDLKIE